MNILDTLLSFETGGCENSYEVYSKDPYVLYMVALYKIDKFICWCINEKINMPQVVLYIYMIRNDIGMCNACLMSGCEINEKFMKLACMLNNSCLISLALKKGLKPDEKDLITICDDFYEYIIISNKESYVMIDPDIFFERIFFSRKSNGYYDKIDKTITAKAECLNIIKKTGIVFSTTIYEKCIMNKIKINLDKNDEMEYIESQCNTRMNKKEIKEFCNKISNLKDNKISEKSYDNLVGEQNYDVILNLLDIKNFKIEDHNLEKLANFSLIWHHSDLLEKILKLNPNIIKKEGIYDYIKEHHWCEFIAKILDIDSIFILLDEEIMEYIRIFAFSEEIDDLNHPLIKKMIKIDENIIRENIEKYIDLYWVNIRYDWSKLNYYCGLLNIKFISDILAEHPKIIYGHFKYLYDIMKQTHSIYNIHNYMNNEIITNIMKNNIELFKKDLTELKKYIKTSGIFSLKYNDNESIILEKIDYIFGVTEDVRYT
jgi:hypothetical protein